jgi:branched-chain amino acid aminotransferase
VLHPPVESAAESRQARECDFTLAQVHSADEAFVTGTLGGVTPVTKVDGWTIGDGRPGAQTIRAGELYLHRVTAAPHGSVVPG